MMIASRPPSIPATARGKPVSRRPRAGKSGRRLVAFCWAMIAWILLTWTAPVEQAFVGAIVSTLTAACAPPVFVA